MQSAFVARRGWEAHSREQNRGVLPNEEDSVAEAQKSRGRLSLQEAGHQA